MNNLKLIESKENFVNVYETDKGEKVVNGRDLWEVLGSKRKFATWIKQRLNECDALENKDYVSFDKIVKRDNGATTRKEYIIKLNTAKEMSMLERNQKGKEVRRYFIEIEERFKESLSIQPKTPIQLLELEFQAIKEVGNKVEEVKQDLEDFKQDMPLLALEIDKIKNARNRTAVNVLGGKDSNAYKNRSLRSKVYQDMSKEIKRQFGVETYKAIKRNQCDKVIEIIKSYVPPMYLLQEIENENLQLAI